MKERSRRNTYFFALRYIPGSRLAARFPGIARGRFRTRREAENVRAACKNADQIEVVDVREAS